MGFTNQPGKRRLLNPWQYLYDRAAWRGPNGLRRIVLGRDPVCVLCERNASEVADHIEDHKGNWDKFTDLENLRGVCKPCHDEKTGVTSNSGGADPNAPVPTGEPGKQFTTGVPKKVDKLLAEVQDVDVEELLKSLK